MFLYPPLTITWANGFLLILPMLALRFGLPALISRESLTELDYFPPVQGGEQLALKVYFVTNTFLVFSPLLAKIDPLPGFKVGSWIIYLSGILILSLGLIGYSRQKGLKTAGIYKYSRNPICVGCLVVFLGTALLISSWFHLLLTIIYQAAVHGLILSEERWCLDEFGETYRKYCSTTARYFII